MAKWFLKIFFYSKNLISKIRTISRPKVFSNRLTISPQDTIHKNLTSPRRLNHLVQQFNLKNYLEIGVERGQTLESIHLEIKYGVDPNPLFDDLVLPQGVILNRIKSDLFFKSNVELTFDLIFIDGLHEAKQAYRDLINSFKILNKGGFILLDDIWPSDFASSISDKNISDYYKSKLGLNHRRWYGDVFKVVAAANYFHPEIKVQIIGNGVESHSQALLWASGGSENITFNKQAYAYMRSIDFDETFNPIHLPWSNWITEEKFFEIINSKYIS